MTNQRVVEVEPGEEGGFPRITDELNNLKDALTGTLLWRSRVLAVFQQLQTSNSHERAVVSWLMTWILSFV
ncbi:hypothetical protein EMCRGX_G003139 [Ephydatia muelleri]